MGKLSNPKLFSVHFGLPSGTLESAGLIDPFLEVDTPLFVDPLLLGKSAFPQISDEGLKAFKAHFAKFIRLLSLSDKPKDAPWRGAEEFLDLSEPPANGLGYGTTGRSGSSRPDRVKRAIMRTASEVINLGSKDPEMISLMPFFEEDVGPDTISDFTTHVITPQLAQITNDFCVANAVPVHLNDLIPQIRLPKYVDANGNESILLLVPQDIVRELPIARSASDIEKSINHNSTYRGQVNSFFNAMTKATVEERKEAIRHFALSSKDAFEEFLEMVKDFNSHYDPNDDALGYYKMRDILANGFANITTSQKFDLSSGISAVKEVALAALEIFKHHVENGNLWEELWVDGKPKKERAAQLLYFAIADAFCKANNIDISPEAHMGGGPVDFKFSKGYSLRVVVELKRSNGAVKHGYEKQLEIYKNAAQTNHGIFVVMNYGDLGKKLTQIKTIKTYREANGESASDIIVIDATQKLSASKR